jgi:hypothetical protein
MTKEYHVHTENNDNYQINLVFETERSSDGSMYFTELWIMSTQAGKYLKTRINLEHLVQRIGENVGGNVRDEDIPQLAEIFSEVLTREKQIEIQLDLCEKDISKSSTDPIVRLLKAQELSEILYSGDNGNAQEIIDRVVIKKLNNQ